MVDNCWAIGSSSFEATKACLMRAVCATRDARLVRWVGLCFVVGFPAGLPLLDCAVPDTVPGPDVSAAGVAVDCDPPDCAMPDQPSISNPNRRTKLPGPRRRTGNGDEKPNIIPLYADWTQPV